MLYDIIGLIDRVIHVTMNPVIAGLFRCNIKPDGNVFIKGVSTTGEETVYRNSQLFKMKSQNLCPPGPFSISFELPGPVDDQQISTSFENGVFEAMVKKR